MPIRWILIAALVACKGDPAKQPAPGSDPGSGSAAAKVVAASPTPPSPLPLLAEHQLPYIEPERAVWIDDKLVIATSVPSKDGNLEQSDVLVVEYDAMGKELWRREIRAEGAQYLRSLAATSERIRLIVSSDRSVELGAIKLDVPPDKAGKDGPHFVIVLDGSGQLVSGTPADAGEGDYSLGLPDGGFAQTTGLFSENAPPRYALRLLDAKGVTRWRTSLRQDAVTEMVIGAWKPPTLMTVTNAYDLVEDELVGVDLTTHAIRHARAPQETRFLVPTPSHVIAFATHAPESNAASQPIDLRVFKPDLTVERSKTLQVDPHYRLNNLYGAYAPDGTIWLTTAAHSHGVLVRVSEAGEIVSELALPAFKFGPTPVISGPHIALTGECADSTAAVPKLCVQFIRADALPKP